MHYIKKYGYYTPEPEGSPDWKEYWQEQRRRCLNGYSSGGVKITGDHYFYLNYNPIKKTEDTKSKRSRKIIDFADFWDGDYSYYWSREIARKGILGALDVPEEKEEEIPSENEHPQIVLVADQVLPNQ